MEAKGLTLIHWNVRGVAEPIKMLLEYLHLSYKEVRVDLDDLTADPWSKVKDSLNVDFPTLPCFRDSDSNVALSGMMAICRFLGQKYRPKMVGSAMNEYAEVDALLFIFHDLRHQLDEAIRDGSTVVRTQTLQQISQQLERVNRYMRSKSWLSGKQVSIADFVFCDFLDYLATIDPTLIEAYPHLKKLQRKFNTLPEIVKYKETQESYDRDKSLKVPPNTER